MHILLIEAVEVALQPEMAFLAKDDLHSRHEVLDKTNLSPMLCRQCSIHMKVFYPYDGIRQLLQKCFLLVLRLVDVQQVNQELDGSTLENKINHCKNEREKIRMLEIHENVKYQEYQQGQQYKEGT